MRNRVLLRVRGGFLKQRQEPAVTSALWVRDRTQTQRQWNQEVVWRGQETDPRNTQAPCQKLAKTRRAPERGGFGSPSTAGIIGHDGPEYAGSSTERYGKEMRDLFSCLNIMSTGPRDPEPFLYGIYVNVDGNEQAQPNVDRQHSDQRWDRPKERCEVQDQEVTTEPLPGLIHSARSSSYPIRNSVRTIHATPCNRRGWTIQSGNSTIA